MRHLPTAATLAMLVAAAAPALAWDWLACSPKTEVRQGKLTNVTQTGGKYNGVFEPDPRFSCQGDSDVVVVSMLATHLNPQQKRALATCGPGGNECNVTGAFYPVEISGQPQKGQYTVDPTAVVPGRTARPSSSHPQSRSSPPSAPPRSPPAVPPSLPSPDTVPGRAVSVGKSTSEYVVEFTPGETRGGYRRGEATTLHIPFSSVHVPAHMTALDDCVSRVYDACDLVVEARGGKVSGVTSVTGLGPDTVTLRGQFLNLAPYENKICKQNRSFQVTLSPDSTIPNTPFRAGIPVNVYIQGGERPGSPGTTSAPNELVRELCDATKGSSTVTLEIQRDAPNGALPDYSFAAALTGVN